MTQNIYDDPDFFQGYSQMARSINGLDAAPEWPALKSMLPPMQGLNVVDLGCGYGWFCRWASEQGADKVLGLDVSEKMLGQARKIAAASNIRYERADLEHLDLPAASFDLACSPISTPPSNPDRVSCSPSNTQSSWHHETLAGSPTPKAARAGRSIAIKWKANA